MTLQHAFQYRAKDDLVELFQGVKKFSTFIRNIEKLSIKNISRYNPDKYKGDAWEFFCEIFANAFKYDNRIGIGEYSPVQANDNGVDATGVNLEGKKSVIQCKFRSDNRTLLTATEDKLSHLISDGILAHKVTPIEDRAKEVYRHYVMTTAKGLHFYTDGEFFKSTVKCIGYDDFRVMLENNSHFWELCRKIAEDLSKK